MTDSLVGLLDAEIVHTIIRKPFDIEMVGALMAAVVAEGKAASRGVDFVDAVDTARKSTSSTEVC